LIVETLLNSDISWKPVSPVDRRNHFFVTPGNAVFGSNSLLHDC
jgi:hypothetical protein